MLRNHIFCFLFFTCSTQLYGQNYHIENFEKNQWEKDLIAEICLYLDNVLDNNTQDENKFVLYSKYSFKILETAEKYQQQLKTTYNITPTYDNKYIIKDDLVGWTHARLYTACSDNMFKLEKLMNGEEDEEDIEEEDGFKDIILGVGKITEIKEENDTIVFICERPIGANGEPEIYYCYWIDNFYCKFDLKKEYKSLLGKKVDFEIEVSEEHKNEDGKGMIYKGKLTWIQKLKK